MATAGKILALIVMLIAFVLVGLVGAAIAKEGLFNRMEKYEQSTAELDKFGDAGAAVAAAMGVDLAAATKAADKAAAQVKLWGYSGVVMVLLALGVLVLAFAKRFTPLLILAGVGAAVAVAIVLMFPQAEFKDDGMMIQVLAGLFAIQAAAALGYAKLASKGRTAV